MSRAAPVSLWPKNYMNKVTTLLLRDHAMGQEVRRRLKRLETITEVGSDFAQSLIAARLHRKNDVLGSAHAETHPRLLMSLKKRADGEPLSAIDRARLRVHDGRIVCRKEIR